MLLKFRRLSTLVASFAVPLWLSFPLAAITIASFAYARVAASAGHLWIGTGFLALLVAVILGLVARTAVAIRRGEICRPE